MYVAGKQVGKLGALVYYKSKIDNGPGNDVISPAVVIRTVQSNVVEVIDRWGPEPQVVRSASDGTVTHETAGRPDGVLRELPDSETVDLIVFGLGKTYREYGVKRGSERGQWMLPNIW